MRFWTRHRRKDLEALLDAAQQQAADLFGRRDGYKDIARRLWPNALGVSKNWTLRGTYNERR